MTSLLAKRTLLLVCTAAAAGLALGISAVTVRAQLDRSVQVREAPGRNRDMRNSVAEQATGVQHVVVDEDEVDVPDANSPAAAASGLPEQVPSRPPAGISADAIIERDIEELTAEDLPVADRENDPGRNLPDSARQAREAEEEPREIVEEMTGQRAAERGMPTVENVRAKAREAHEEPRDAVDDEKGCLAPDGSWTTDREACATASVETRAGSPAVEEELRRALRERFIPSATVEQRRTELLLLIDETRRKLGIVRDARLVTPQDEAFIAKSAEWLDGGFSYFSAPERTDGELRLMAGYVRQVIDHAATLVEAAQKERGPTPDIGSILARTERMIILLPQIAELIRSEGITLPDDVYVMIDNARFAFDYIRDACVANRDACGHLREVLDTVEQAQLAMKAAIAASGKTDIEAKIRKKLEATAM